MTTYSQLQIKDVNEIRKLALASWLVTYKNIFTKNSIRRQVLNHYSDKNFQEVAHSIKAKEGYFVIARKNNILVGFANVGGRKKKWELTRIYVTPTILRKRIGSGLLHNVEFFLQSKGIKRYCAHPHPKNSSAIKFYLKTGFKRNKIGDIGDSSPCYLKVL